jgi:hypothetical protein
MSKDMNMEAEKGPALQTTTRRQLEKIQQIEET